MIEVGVNGLGEWAWTMISAAGRTLVYREGYRSQAIAIKAARAYRAVMQARAARIDDRMGANL